jgi:purine nucleosidase
VAGNVRLDKTSRNARLAREWAGREDVPVYAGAPKPLVRTPIYAENIHGQEGVTGVPVHEPAKGLEKANAVNYLVDTLRAAKPGSVTIAMLGPQTNLALALIQAPEITQGIKEVVVMGGAHFNGGNITPVAEFNLYADPHAADVVLKSGVKLTYVPLDVTHKILTSEARLKQIAALGGNPALLRTAGDAHGRGACGGRGAIPRCFGCMGGIQRQFDVSGRGARNLSEYFAIDRGDVAEVFSIYRRHPFAANKVFIL